MNVYNVNTTRKEILCEKFQSRSQRAFCNGLHKMDPRCKILRLKLFHSFHFLQHKIEIGSRIGESIGIIQGAVVA